jgi:hypothetical protein
MLRDTAIAAIQRRLGFRAASWKSADIIAELQLAQTELEDEFLGSPPWFLLIEHASLATVALDELVALPSDFLAEYEQGGALYLYDSTAAEPWQPLTKGFEEALRAEQNGTSGRPKKYALSKAHCRLFPAPDAVYTLSFSYYGRDAVLSTNIENQWLKFFPGLLWNRAGMAMAEAAEDIEALGRFQTKYSEAMLGLRARIAGRRIDNTNLVREDI